MTGQIMIGTQSKSFKFYLRNRFLLTVIYCPIYHWLEVSRQENVVDGKEDVIKRQHDSKQRHAIPPSDLSRNKSLEFTIGYIGEVFGLISVSRPFNTI